ncbi:MULTISPECIES: pyridoxamine 5'-phosphate oxidase family protein [Sphingobium]|uniref:pyridoxamine 5'-phosphate oxidase family protein n=1 Tax=Sphingobium TaxID=165695 RepID=UPI0015EC679E|nr:MULTISPECIES: pyridoxamine 5'-phosphate oxidase family protein [Sphingobium]MCW2362323.1 general stress protein 26 [Sphingobium sp. B10D3B]MCW2395051.1 general stress protein 26 [Sphingobium sp. B8D3B]MCW2400998.1 general stress protein 26 [Sphingobium sp. B10D7B]MCW2407977.1 general stress protein 26 [Sphingobium xanthum]MCW2418565.1 general stress protein 26 [Sphingobium sp. B8D3C]
MADMTLDDLSEKMGKIDFGMLSTRTEGGALASRPMSNNGEVAWRGDSFFFTYEAARTIADIERDPEVGLTFTGAVGLLGGPPLFIAVEGRAELIRDKARFAEHWNKDLERWFEQGIDTPDLVMIQVRARRIHYWNGSDEGEVPL